MNHKYRRELFPITIFQGSVENNEILKELTIPHIKSTKNISNSAPDGWFTNKIITSFDKEELNKNLTEGDVGDELRRQYLKVLSSFFDDYWEISITNLWYNYYENGEYQEDHTHVSVLNDIHFSCVHFLSYDSNIHAPLTFNDPLRLTRNFSMEMKSNRYSERYNIFPKEGDFVMFPSYLSHEVKPGKPTPQYPRITISFNINVNSYGNEPN
jgi:predicted 2-oxoglutarate/Fe(II)-dependent dioxygenase YbiX